MTTIAVVYDVGAVSAAEILAALLPRFNVVAVLATSEHARSMRAFFDEECLAVVDTEDPALVQSLLGLAVEGVVTYSERMLPMTAAIAERCGLRGHAPDVLAAVSDKAVQRSRLHGAGGQPLRCSRVDAVEDWAEAVRTVGLPAVLKPANGESSRNTFLIRDSDAGRGIVDRVLPAEGRLVVEEYLEGVAVDEPFGDYVSVESAVLPTGPIHYAVTGKFQLAPPFREAGQFWPARITDEVRAAVVALAGQAIEAVGIRTGLVHTEVKLTPSGPRVIEVNGRMGGLQQDLAERAAGLNLIGLAADLAAGRIVDPGTVQLDRVYFQLYNPGPTAAGTLVRTSGAAQVRAMPGVTRHRSVARPGDPVGGTSTHILDITFGDVPDHDSLAALIRAITEQLVYEFEVDETIVTRTAADLRAHD